MNKKFSTLVATLLLSGALFTLNATPLVIGDLEAIPQIEVVAATSTTPKTIKFTGDVTLSGKDYILIDEDDVVIDGQNKYTLTGHIVIIGENCKVTGLTIDFTNPFNGTEHNDTDGNGTQPRNRGAIVVNANQVTITNNKITAKVNTSSPNLKADGIILLPTAKKVEYTITGNQITAPSIANEEEGAVGIALWENLKLDGTEVTPAVALDATPSFDLSQIKECAVDYQYVSYEGYNAQEADYGMPILEAVVTPNASNAVAIKDIVKRSSVKSDITFNGTVEELQNIIDAKIASENNVAVQCTGDENGEGAANVLYGNAENPSNGNPVAIVGVEPMKEDLSGYELAENATSDYSMLILHSNQDHSDWAISTGEEHLATEVTADNINNFAIDPDALWQMSSRTDKDGTIWYQFKNQSGKTLEVKGETWFKAENKAAYNNGVVLALDGVDLTDTNKNYFGLYKAGNVALTGAQLNGFEKDGFSVTITCDKQNDSKWDDELAGNPFVGHLTAMNWNRTDFSVSTSDGSYYLKNSDGKYIVAEKYDGEGSDVSQAIYGFTTISEADLKLHLQRVYQGLEVQKYFGEFSAKISAADINTTEVNADILGLETLVSLQVNGIGQVGRYDFSGVPTLAVSTKTKMKAIQIKMGSNLIVDWKEFLQKGKFYTVERTANGASKHTLGKVVADAVSNSGDVTGASVVSSYGNVLEGQWAVTYNTSYKYYTFTNRENAKVSFTIQANSLYLTKNNAANTYRYGEDTYVIKPVAEHAATDGYKTLSDLKNTKFNIGFSSSVFDGNAWFTENHEGTSNHTIGLDTDIDNALVFTATEYADARSKELDETRYKYYPTDSIYVVSTLGYYNAELKGYDVVSDTLKVVSYSFENQWGEPLSFNVIGNKYESSTEEKPVPVLFTLREDGEKLNLRPVTLDATVQDEPDYNAGTLFNTFGLNYNKVYAGDAANGILANVGLYDRTENDLFVVEPTAKPMYRKVVNNLDTISIFRQENDKQLLFEDGKFLGLKNASQFDFAPAMLADTAYVRYNTYRPQYLLAVDPVMHGETTWCPEHGYGATCQHAQTIKGYVEGRYLVNLVDTAIAWDKANKHKDGNPYINSEKYYRLGFVQATHRNDSLIIANDNNRIFLGNNDYNLAKFAFRYVDQNAGSFVIETANYKQLPDATKAEITGVGYIKWMNGVVVVVDDIENADVFNMNENEEGNPTANETIAAGNVVVAGVDGAVVVKGAEGKNVIVSTILGKVVANEVLTSDNAQIAAPAGIVVVSVDGESFKVVVK